MAVNGATIVAPPPSISARFYEPVILLKALVKVNHDEGTVKEPDLESDTGKSPRDAFFCFVNKLGQICRNKTGPDAVTAFAVLQPGSIEYRFASNKRTLDELEQVKAYITDVLKTLGQTPDADLKSISHRVLQKILGFNRAMVVVYIKLLHSKLDFCIGSCDLEATVEGIIPPRPRGLRSPETG